MRQGSDRLGLALEAGESGGIVGRGRRENLDRDFAAEAGVARAIDLAHPSSAERSQDLVRPQA